MRYLVTGGTGFIGSYVVRQLLERGDEPVVLDADLRQGIIERVVVPEALRSLAVVQGTITDLPSVLNLLKKKKVRKIIHLAAMQIPACQDNPGQGLDSNCFGTLNMFEAARILDLEKVVWASSVAVFGAASAHGNGRIANDAPHRPNTLYGSYKSTCEQLARHYTDAYGVDTIGLRYGGVYGLGRNRGKTSFSTAMIEKAVAGEAYTVPFATDLFGWHFVEDAAEVTIRAVDSAQTRTRSFNTHWDLRPVADGVRYLKTLVPRAQLELEPGTMDIAWNVDAQVLEDELKYRPRHTMEDGIRKTVEALQKEKKSGH